LTLPSQINFPNYCPAPNNNKNAYALISSPIKGTTVISLLSFLYYSYQKDERAQLGNLQKRDNFYSPKLKRIFTSPLPVCLFCSPTASYICLFLSL